MQVVEERIPAWRAGARRRVLTGRLDADARLIRWFERLGRAYDVRRPDLRRITARRGETPQDVRDEHRRPQE
ncbi:hypothetical protein [Streptomyces sp. NPDC007905]|uniref:hypothetical protein n=1 Tax=Streptomyces sp. NPDC007905 TaxID=3364788 RepID=UPI0036EBD4BD